MKKIALLPYDNEYVLIHKRALFVNNYALSILCQFMSKSSREQKRAIAQYNHVQIMEMFTQIAINESNKLTDGQINKIVLEGVVQANDPKHGKALIQVNFDENPPDDAS